VSDRIDHEFTEGAKKVWIYGGLEEGRTRRQCSEDHAPDALVETPGQERAVHSTGLGIKIELGVVLGLEARLEGVKRVDEEVNCEGSDGAGLDSG